MKVPITHARVTCVNQKSPSHPGTQFTGTKRRAHITELETEVLNLLVLLVQKYQQHMSGRHVSTRVITRVTIGVIIRIRVIIRVKIRVRVRNKKFRVKRLK